MKTILTITISVFALGNARPETSSGYSYPVPAGPTLSLPGPSIGGSHGVSSIGHGTDISQISLTTSGLGSSYLGGHGGGSSLSTGYLPGGSSLASGVGSSSSSTAFISGGHGSSSLGSGYVSGGHGSSSLGSGYLSGGHGSSSLGSGYVSGGHGSSSLSSGYLSGSSSLGSGYLSGGHGSSSFGSGATASSSSSSSSSAFISGSHGSSSFGSGGLGSSSFGSGGSSAFLAGGQSFGGSASLGNLGGGSTLVQKHIYVHVPPPEPEDLRPQRIVQTAPAQKHYRIIFIKAPSPPAPTLPSIPVQPQNEEKTLVYVLVKKPEEAPELTIPTPAPTQPSKPEVYFIRYKTQKEHGSSAGFSAGHSIDEGSLDAHGGLGSFTASSSSSSGGSSFVSGGSAGLTTSYGPPGHIPGPY